MQFLARILIIAVFIMLNFTGPVSAAKTGLLIPIGRLLQSNNKIQLSINKTPYEAALIADGSGGYWLRIPFDMLAEKARINITITKTNPNNLLHEENSDVKKMDRPVFFDRFRQPGHYIQGQGINRRL